MVLVYGFILASNGTLFQIKLNDFFEMCILEAFCNAAYPANVSLTRKSRENYENVQVLHSKLISLIDLHKKSLKAKSQTGY